MGLRFEAWTLPTAATFEKLADVLPLGGSAGVRTLSGWSDATLNLPSSFDHTELVSASAGSWIRVYSGTTLIDEFLAERVASPIDRPGVTSVSGPQRNGLVEKCAIYPYNYPNDAPGAQDWHWGLDENALRNGSGEDNPLGLANPGFETAVPNPWWAGAVVGVSANLSVVTTSPRTGTYHALVDALLDEGGMSTSVKVYPGRDYRFAIHGQTPSGSHDWQLGATGPSAIQVLAGDRVIEFSGHFAGTYEAQADATYTTSYAQNELQFRAAPDQTSTQLNIRYIGGAPTQSLHVDDIEWEGFGIGIDGWDYSPQVVDFQVAQDVTASDGSYHFRVVAPPNAGVFQGVRTFVPGETVSFEVDMRGPSADVWTVELRDLTGTLIHQTPVTLNTGAWGTGVGTVTLPTFLPGDGTVQFWLVNHSPGESTLYFDRAKLFSGLPAATYTEILRLLIEAAQARGTFTFLDLDFTDAVDSAGTSLAPISFSAFFGANGHIGQVLRDGNSVGYEWRMVAKATPVGALTHDLQVWAPGGGPGDLTATAGGPSVLAGGKVENAELVTRIPGYTALLVHGADHLRLEDTDPTAVTNLGRWERVIDAEAVTSLGTLQQVADASFAGQTTNRDAVSAVVLETDQTIPLVDYTEGNVIWWQLPGLTGKEAKQVRRVGWTHGTPAKFELQGSRVLTGEGAMAAAVDLLLDEFRRRRGAGRREFGTSEVVAAGGGVGAHIHLLGTSQSIPVGGAPVTFSAFNTTHPARHMSASFPAQVWETQQNGYYDIGIDFAWETWEGGGTVTLVRIRGGVQTPVWPQISEWDSTNGREFLGSVAKGIECLAGDQFQVYVTHGDSTAKTLEWAAVSCELVDRTSAPVTAALAPGGLEIDCSSYDSGGTASGGGDATVHPVNLPSSVSGDALFFVLTTGSTTHTTPGGWTLLGTQTGSVSRVSWYWKIASGSDGATVNVTIGSSLRAAAVAWRVRSGVDYSTFSPDFASANMTNDAPGVTPSHGLADYVSLVALGATNWWFFSGPPGYTARCEARCELGTAKPTAYLSALEATTDTTVVPGAAAPGADGGAGRNWHTGHVLVKVG